MKEKLRRFMAGRYGADQLNRFLSILILVFCGVMLVLQAIATRQETVSTAMSVALRILTALLWASLIFSVFRMFSKNYAKRSEENKKYLAIKYKITSKFNLIKRQIKDRKLYKYFSCPQCGKTLRVPKGKGKVRVTCPNCANSFIKES